MRADGGRGGCNGNKTKWERWQGLKMINRRMLHGTKLGWCSRGVRLERWSFPAWVLRRSLAAGTLSAWVTVHDGVTCGQKEKGEDNHHWRVMKGCPLRRSFLHPWPVPLYRLMHTVSCNRTIYIGLVGSYAVSCEILLNSLSRTDSCCDTFLFYASVYRCWPLEKLRRAIDDMFHCPRGAFLFSRK